MMDAMKDGAGCCWRVLPWVVGGVALGVEILAVFWALFLCRE
jgi:hypothetical protein